MIVFDLECRTGGHRFEGWFGSSDDFAQQKLKGLLNCPQCGSSAVEKAPMAPNLARKGNQASALAPVSPKPDMPASVPAGPSRQPVAQGALPPEALKMMQALHAMQSEALKQSNWVGDTFAETARAMHYGEREAKPIHGEATLTEAKELWEEGIEVAPLPFPVAKPGEAN